MTWVKICGMTNVEDALVAVEAGADAVGFVFYEKSPRYVSVEAAREIVEKLPESVEKVGVFVDSESEAIRAVVMGAGLTAVQLHGERSKESVVGDPRNLADCVAASKAILVIDGDSLIKEGFFMMDDVREKAFAVLLDSRSNGEAGGTGVTFDWEPARAMAQMVSLHVPVIVAGGLTPSNVVDAMTIFLPFGVDVASGVEARPGKKDPGKVRAFVRAVRDFDRKAG
ncbi:MAG TPA: phosphoribosylanthranilate isomerase [Candidatus Sulfotelmatobacter sp.]|jgi:phosphoribosylanthranilate isomerase